MNEQLLRGVATIFAAGIEALAEIEAMKVANAERARRGESLAYGEEQFRNVILERGLYWNAVRTTLGL